MSSVAVSTPIRSPIGSFGPDVFASHLSSIAGKSAWWLDRKRTAFEKFSSSALPKRTDEMWGFSNIGTLSLDGFALTPASPTTVAALAVESAATLSFVNNLALAGKPLSADLLSRGVIVTTLAQAIAKHPELLREHFMAQPQKLGSEKFAALHTAYVSDGAFVYVPQGVEIASPILVTYIAQGAGAAVFPHTLVVAGERSKVT